MSETTDLQKLINDSHKFIEFKEFLQITNPHSGLQNLNFYLAYLDLRKRLPMDSAKSSLRFIRTIYRTYIKTGPNHSLSSISISNQTRKFIRTRIKMMNESNLDNLIFNRAFHEVEEYLEKKFIVEFQNHLILKQIRENQNQSLIQNDSQYRTNDVKYDEYSFSKTGYNSKKSEEFDPNKFHQMLTERLSQLKLPLSEDNSFEKLTPKTNNEFLLKMIQRTQSMDIDIEADALSALDNQYKKIGRNKQEEPNNIHRTKTAYGTPLVKNAIFRTNIPFFWRCRLKNHEQRCHINCELNPKLMMDMECYCQKD